MVPSPQGRLGGTRRPMTVSRAKRAAEEPDARGGWNGYGTRIGSECGRCAPAHLAEPSRAGRGRWPVVSSKWLGSI